MAVIGALAGAAAGVLAWWGITVWSNTAFGLVAILIGLAVGKGSVLLSGNRGARSLQILSVVVSGVAFFYATYLVNRTFLLQTLAEEGNAVVLSVLPNPITFIEVVRLGFGGMDFLFLAIVLYEAWKLPAPARTA